MRKAIWLDVRGDMHVALEASCSYNFLASLPTNYREKSLVCSMVAVKFGRLVVPYSWVVAEARLFPYQVLTLYDLAT